MFTFKSLGTLLDNQQQIDVKYELDYGTSLRAVW